ncbi:MAG: glycosyltransferase family 4 protein [Gammaproteobacteria bacterium]|nr:glycosyltransferase family 4 protein [Gammaproteobacteria bacterium]
MKILEVCMSKGYGGLELYVLKVVKFLAANRHSYGILTRTNSFLYNKLSEQNISADSFSSVFRHFPLLSALKLAKYIDRNEIDVLHVHWGNDLFFAVLAKVFAKRKIRLVYTRQMSLTRKKNDFYHRFLYKNVDAYLVITKVLRNDAVKFLPISPDKIHLLYYGVPAANGTKEICTEFLESKNINPDVFRLAIFGRIEKGKGQHLVVDAVKNLIKQGKDIQLALIGHIMDENYFKGLEDEISKNKLDKNISYLGFHNNPTSIMSCFNAVVLATKCETFGLVLPEAMRAGAAVIGSACGGVPEIIEHEKTGLLFESENVDDLTLQLAKIVDDKNFCQQLAKAGKEDADERFSEEKHFSRLLELFGSA